MRVLAFLSIGLDRQATSGHLMTAIIQALCEAGHSVHIIQKDTGGDLPPIPKALSTYSITTDCIPFHSTDKGNFVARYLAELKYISNSRKHMTSDYDAVFIQSTTAGGFAVKAVRSKLPKAIVTFNVQDIFPYNLMYSGKLKKHSPVFQALAGVQRYGYRHSDHIITISEDMKDLLVEDGTEPDKIEVIYNWSYQDEPYDNLDLTPVNHMFNHEYFNVVYAGNIGVMQNVDIIIEAAKLMKDDNSVWFHIIGNGVYKDKLVLKAKEYGISNISFWPMQPSVLAPLIYSAADVNVIPLIKNGYRTALPSKTATCLACEKPIIFAFGEDSKYGKSIMKEADCKVIEPEFPEKLTEEIYRLKSGENGSNMASYFRRNYSVSINSKRYAKMITRREY